ncbi:inhibitor of growth proteins N-terminal histone-binding-domain-containing protein [Chytridium lagenaria]|nr:inhibitor of growth proteins N-terminal histone-binding-domain-containing protein [Chytridium lagenaria]
MAATSAFVYLEDYLDTVESLPAELMRNFSLLRELDSKAQDLTQVIETETHGFMDSAETLTPEKKREMILHLTRTLREYRKHGEEKVGLAIQAYDLVDRHIRRLDEDLAKYDEEQMTGPKIASSAAQREESRALRAAEKNAAANGNSLTNSAGAAMSKLNDNRRDSNKSSTPVDTPSKKRKTKDRQSEKPAPPEPVKDITPRKDKNGKSATVPASKNPSNQKKGDKNRKGGEAAKVASTSQQKLSSSQDLPIDPNEPKYCVCQQVSFGEMVECDNENCEFEWFHYSCVGLTAPPKGSWYCPNCEKQFKKKK